MFGMTIGIFLHVFETKFSSKLNINPMTSLRILRFYTGFLIFVAILSLTLVDKHPAVLFVTFICFVFAIMTQEYCDWLNREITSNASEDRPE